MKCWRLIASGLMLIEIFSTSCTIEKRLYNRGYHVEYKSSHRHETVSEEKPLLYSDEFVVEDETDLVLVTITDSVIVPQELPVSQEQQTTMEQKDSSTDTVPKPFDEKRKKKILTGLAIPMMACVGLGTVMIFKSAAATGSWVAGLGYALGFLFFSFIFLVLFIIFLIFLIRKTDEKKDELNNPEHRTVSE